MQKQWCIAVGIDIIMMGAFSLVKVCASITVTLKVKEWWIKGIWKYLGLFQFPSFLPSSYMVRLQAEVKNNISTICRQWLSLSFPFTKKTGNVPERGCDMRQSPQLTFSGHDTWQRTNPLSEFSLQLSGLRTQCSFYKNAGLIPALAQWVKNLTLSQAVL